VHSVDGLGAALEPRSSWQQMLGMLPVQHHILSSAG
jgi:hypothetical protein